MAKPVEEYTDRQRLRKSWANYRCLFKTQPIDEIRNYFGEKIALYFAWVGYYTQSLIIPTIIGIIVPIYGLAHAFTTPYINEICQNTPTANLTVCRYCSGNLCPYSTLGSYCTKVQLVAVFTNGATVVFTFIMSVWAALFQERWKRQQARLAAHWECFDDNPRVEQVRPDYYRYATEKKPHPVTGKEELYVPRRSRLQNLTRSAIIILAMVFIVIAAVTGVIFYKMICGALISRAAETNSSLAALSPTLMDSVTGACINTIIILILSKVYGKLAWWLTVREYPRTWKDFERSYVIKMFAFQFVNYYSYMFYLAFVFGNLASNPTEMSMITGDNKTPGFFSEVTLELAIILIAKQVFGNILEVSIPWLKIKWKSRKNVKSTDENPYDQWEQDFDLCEPEPLNLTPEYFEMILQYGLITMFVPAFPLAPLLALLNNIFEIRIDGIKFLVEYRREVPMRTANIGIFYELLDFASTLAILVNGAVIAFTSNIVPRLVMTYLHGSENMYWNLTMSVYEPPRHQVPATWNSTKPFYCVYDGLQTPPWSKYPYQDSHFWWQVWLGRVAFMLMYENLIFVIKTAVDTAIPDVPEEVVLKQERQKYLAQQAMYSHEFGGTSFG